MIKKTPVVIDGNIFLMAHSENILGHMSAKDVIYNSNHENPMYRGRGILIKSLLAMIFKNLSDMKKMGLSPTSVGIVWDKKLNGKYHKSSIIDKLNSSDGYKGNRKFLTQEDISKLELDYIECSNSKEKSELKKTLDEAKKSQIINYERMIARDYIINNFGKFGISSFQLPGWEADDLDFIFALETEKLGGNQIHYSGDSDWSFSLRPKDIFWQVNRGKLHKKSYEEVKTKFGISESQTLMDWAELFYSAKGSHNNLIKTFDPFIKRVTKKHLDKLFSGDFSDISDMNRFEAQRQCFKIEEFSQVEVVRDLHKELINFNPSGSVTDFMYMLDDLSIGADQKHILKSNYNKFVADIRESILNSYECN